MIETMFFVCLRSATTCVRTKTSAADAREKYRAKTPLLGALNGHQISKYLTDSSTDVLSLGSSGADGDFFFINHSFDSLNLVKTEMQQYLYTRRRNMPQVASMGTSSHNPTTSPNTPQPAQRRKNKLPRPRSYGRLACKTKNRTHESHYAENESRPPLQHQQEQAHQHQLAKFPQHGTPATRIFVVFHYI